MHIYVKKRSMVKAIQWTGNNLLEIQKAFPVLRWESNKLFLYSIELRIGEWVIANKEVTLHMSDELFKALYEPMSIKDTELVLEQI